jgi:site-specific DNA-methyltransferase (adenine-specific)
MQIETVDITKLTPYEKNAKLHPRDQIEQIKKSIEMYGNNDPIAVWGENNVIVEGHGRYTALRELGYKTVDIIRLDHLTDEQRREYMLVHNQTTMNSGWDIDLLAGELEDLDFGGFDFGFDLDDLDLGDGERKEVQEDDYDLELPEQPKSKLGDIYQLGRHRVMCGNSLSAEDMALLMDGAMADMILTDPPYNVDYEGTAGKIQNDNMEDAKFREFLKNAFVTADQVLKPGGVIYIWHADSEGFNFRAACKDAGWTVRQCLIWNKNALVMGRQDYQWKHEPCLYMWKDGAAHFWNSDRSQTTVIDCEKPKKNDLHPTMKPIKLFDYLIQNSSRKDEIVLDMFGGSGTTVIACEQDGRTARVMELDPRYVDAILNRYEEFTGEKPQLVRSATE